MTNLQKLETAIREALPELMELSEGCEFKINGILGHYTLLSIPKYGEDSDEVFAYRNLEPDSMDFEYFEKNAIIIGHPVTLLHLLRWLDIVCIEGTSNFDGTVWLKKTVIKLDYSKPLLSQQSDEVIDELVKLIP